MINALIIDDEPRSRKMLEHLVHEYCDGIRIMGMAGCVKQGLDFMDENGIPDLVFLDVELPVKPGFYLLEYYDQQPPFEVIFTTAYKKYALDALKAKALHYLTKPIDIDELIEACDRAKSAIGTIGPNKRKDFPKEHKYKLPVHNGFAILTESEISHIESHQKNTLLYFNNDTEPLELIMGINACLELFEKSNFLRIHRSIIVNPNSISSVLKTDNTLVMENGHVIPIAKSGKSELMKYIKSVEMRQ